MSWRTNPVVITCRNVGRSIGLNKLLTEALSPGRYEDRFQDAMLGAVLPGDVVWDVGANVGLYSQRFSELSGSSGKVFAYEPSPANLRHLTAALAPLANVTVMPMALGERDGVVAFAQGEDSLGATSHIVESSNSNTVAIKVSSGDQLVSSGAAAVPHLIKIDTEGYELDVLRGLTQTLQNQRLRVLCIEMHFGLLERRGLYTAAADIERLLTSVGFSIAWPDSSHIIARRAS